MKNKSAKLFGVVFLAMAGLSCGWANDAASPTTPRLGTIHFKSLTSLTPKPGETIRFEASVSNASYAVHKFTWSVQDPENEAQEFSTASAQEAQISFLVEKLGTYTISGTAHYIGISEVLTGHATVLLEDPSVDPLNFTVRITPSPDQVLPSTDLDVLVGAVDQKNLNWQVDQGKEVHLTVRDGTSMLNVSSTLQLIQTAADPLPMETWLAEGAGTLHLGARFFALFLPDDVSVPPYLLPEQFGAQLPGQWIVDLPAGVEITGNVSGPSGPLSNAYVTLHTRAFFTNLLPVPSTGVKTGEDGSFAIRTQIFEQYNLTDSPARLIVVPSRDSIFPVVEVAGLNPKRALSGWRMIFDQPSLVQVSGKVTRSDAENSVEGALVKLKLDPLSVGRLEIGEDTYDALGQYTLTLTTNADGVLMDSSSGSKVLQVPQGVYTAEIWPGPHEEKNEGYMKITGLEIAGAQPIQLTLNLRSRKKLMGRVKDNEGMPLPGAQVVATSGVASFTGVTDAQGDFVLDVDDQMSYALFVRAERVPTNKKLGSYYQGELAISGANRQLDAIELPRAVALSGWIKTTGNISVGGALLRVWCSSVECANHEILDQTQSLPDGSFELRLPRTPPRQ